MLSSEEIYDKDTSIKCTLVMQRHASWRTSLEEARKTMRNFNNVGKNQVRF